jgi:hypothetical protein
VAWPRRSSRSPGLFGLTLSLAYQLQPNYNLSFVLWRTLVDASGLIYEAFSQPPHAFHYSHVRGWGESPDATRWKAQVRQGKF